MPTRGPNIGRIAAPSARHRSVHSSTRVCRFQAAHWGKGIRDVQYFLIDSLPAEVLAAHEQDLVRYYLDCLGEYGVTLGFEEAWEQYRAFSFQTLMTIVVSLGLGGLTEKDSVMEEILRRSVAAVQRVDFAGWLEKKIL